VRCNGIQKLQQNISTQQLHKNKHHIYYRSQHITNSLATINIELKVTSTSSKQLRNNFFFTREKSLYGVGASSNMCFNNMDKKNINIEKSERVYLHQLTATSVHDIYMVQSSLHCLYIWFNSIMPLYIAPCVTFCHLTEMGLQSQERGEASRRLLVR
jgi:hypothetical protein